MSKEYIEKEAVLDVFCPMCSYKPVCLASPIDYPCRMRTALNAQADMRKEANANGWISVKDRLPKGTGRVLVWVGINYDGMGMYPEVRTALHHSFDKRFYVDHDTSIRGELVGEVTHWMPLPEPPKEEVE